MTATSVLRFGEDTRLPPRKDIKSTPLSQQNISWNYYVDLMDISVGDWRLGFPPGKFDLKSNGSSGCVIDNVTMVTLLQEDAYNLVLHEFDQHFSAFGVKRIYNKSRDSRFCYKYNPKFCAYALMTFHLRGRLCRRASI
ncbi:uncharacterized protein J3R85_002222 [Psidium guajava]|nr:uncharacterized protein J3R85_002222 [Psidium guajava]